MNNFVEAHSYLRSFQVSVAVKVLLGHCKNRTQFKLLQHTLVTMWRNNSYKKSIVSLIAHSLVDTASHCIPHTEEQRATIQLFQVMGSNLTQKPGHSPKAYPFTQCTLSTHRYQDHYFLGSRLVASCSMSKKTLRGIHSGNQEGDSEKASYVTASKGPEFLWKLLQTFEKAARKHNCCREVLTFSSSLHLNKVTCKEKPESC